MSEHVGFVVLTGSIIGVMVFLPEHWMRTIVLFVGLTGIWISAMLLLMKLDEKIRKKNEDPEHPSWDCLAPPPPARSYPASSTAAEMNREDDGAGWLGRLNELERRHRMR